MSEVFLRTAPFYHWLDLQIGDITDDGLEIIMPWRPEIISIPEPQQVVHGGILASLIDLAGIYAVLSQGGQPSGTSHISNPD
ncbi:MAG: hotdog fold thioesterase [Deltaproteobacteria bacterium]|nr:hotdog fold thioesterase [Deltaproteobacteria bacterium]MBT4262622.1 hotdog fold thioesterase [Deltaproteobacteria bacterium]MBT6501415.1 hotdog fold thioesterase [Deltaproteobacteria bacterium]MBT6610735.1 hotdog fold thioesterase [Deltaproteobacteria bacterium]MBT7715028.1 hotdog fold thioesterase [Deltaproteobacteria bacterium]